MKENYWILSFGLMASCQKLFESFWFFFIEDKNLEAHFLLLIFFHIINFQITLFSKMMPNFLQVAIMYTNSQNSIISYRYVDFKSKIFQILYPFLENSTNCITILCLKEKCIEFWFFFSSKTSVLNTKEVQLFLEVHRT